MALTSFVVYDTTTGTIAYGSNGDSATPPTPLPAGHAALDVGLTIPIPGPRTHKVDTAPTPDVLVAKTQTEIDAANDATRKRELERAIAGLDAMKAEMTTRVYDTIEIEAEIDTLVAEHAALP